ncbi:hypothetical protein VN97_g6090 [Penicillium thymicola]|uniref:Uncharacterized protein n=1 Tax=Penicillium thymicola TaxID=293382 RepID=A0AAI9X7T9_PENTH|nr:hypothetical protein VN97_g6090 [Penicillium thymicola]
MNTVYPQSILREARTGNFYITYSDRVLRRDLTSFADACWFYQVSSHIHMSTPSIPASPVRCIDLSKHTTQNNRTILHLQVRSPSGQT